MFSPLCPSITINTQEADVQSAILDSVHVDLRFQEPNDIRILPQHGPKQMWFGQCPSFIGIVAAIALYRQSPSTDGAWYNLLLLRCPFRLNSSPSWLCLSGTIRSPQEFVARLELFYRIASAREHLDETDSLALDRARGTNALSWCTILRVLCTLTKDGEWVPIVAPSATNWANAPPEHALFGI